MVLKNIHFLIRLSACWTTEGGFVMNISRDHIPPVSRNLKARWKMDTARFSVSSFTRRYFCFFFSQFAHPCCCNLPYLSSALPRSAQRSALILIGLKCIDWDIRGRATVRDVIQLFIHRVSTNQRFVFGGAVLNIVTTRTPACVQSSSHNMAAGYRCGLNYFFHCSVIQGVSPSYHERRASTCFQESLRTEAAAAEELETWTEDQSQTDLISLSETLHR